VSSSAEWVYGLLERGEGDLGKGWKEPGDSSRPGNGEGIVEFGFEDSRKRRKKNEELVTNRFGDFVVFVTLNVIWALCR
jgi:hypothetical protein